MEISGLARAADARSTFLIRDIIKFYYHIRVISIFLNDLECSLSNICYILYKNNINKNEKHLKMNNRDATAKKELIQVE